MQILEGGGQYIAPGQQAHVAVPAMPALGLGPCGSKKNTICLALIPPLTLAAAAAAPSLP